MTLVSFDIHPIFWFLLGVMLVTIMFVIYKKKK